MEGFIIESPIAKDLECDHLHGSTGVTEKIKKAMYDAAKEFVYIGFLLQEVKEYEYHWEGGYANVYEYAEAELGFKRSSTKNFIAIAETFGTTTRGCDTIHTMSLQKEYSSYNYSQLTEMLSMSAAQREKASPTMTVREIRELKKEPVPEQQPEIDFGTLDKAIAAGKNKAGGQTSGQLQLSPWDWISVNKGLPETDKRVLVCCETKAHIQSINLAYYDGQAWHGSGSMAGVTHWMELPSLPTVKGSQEALQAVVINNYWTDLRPSVIRKLLNVAHLKYNPKSTYKIEIQLKKENG